MGCCVTMFRARPDLSYTWEVKKDNEVTIQVFRDGLLDGMVIMRSKDDFLRWLSSATEIPQFREAVVELGQTLVPTPAPAAPEKPAASNKLLTASVYGLNLSYRAKNAMVEMKVNTVQDLLDKTEQDILKCWNTGKVTVNGIKAKLKCYGLKLKDS